MKRTVYLSSLTLGCAAILITLAVLPRMVGLEYRPLMHDESLFAHYSYIFMKNGQYTHIPMLHGPTLMLTTGKLFQFFGDRIGVGRMFVALVSLIGMAAGVALWPRRYRWWLALLLLTSPILLFYSRFFRDDMLVATTYLLATLGVARALGGRSRLKPLWAALGACFVVVPLALMESALFFQAAGVTFMVVWLGLRLLMNRPDFALRPGPRPSRRQYNEQPDRQISDKASRRRRRKEIYQDRAFDSIVLPQTEEAAEAEASPPTAPAPLPRRQAVRRLAMAAGWTLGLLAGLAFVFFVYGITYPPEINPRQGVDPTSLAAKLPTPVLKPLLNMKASWDYWKDQHQIHRIGGPLHYHLPILVTYELPMLLALAVGLAWDAFQRRRRAMFYGICFAGWLALWILWRNISYLTFRNFDPGTNPHIPPPLLGRVTGFLHIQPDLSMLLLGMLITPLLAWSLLALREHRVLGAWLAWWGACSLFQYSSAGEKVPWLALHMALPLYLALGWVWTPLLQRLRRPGLAVAALAVLAATAIAVRADLRLIKKGAADPHERIIYNHTPPDFDRYCREHLAAWGERTGAIPFAQRNVLLVADPGWPGVWYFRHCAYQLMEKAPDQLGPNVDLVIGTRLVMEPLVAKLDRSRWRVIVQTNPEREFSLRDHWLAPWPSEANPEIKKLPTAQQWSANWSAWWNYYWFRTTWTPPGTFPLIAIEPVTPR